MRTNDSHESNGIGSGRVDLDFFKDSAFVLQTDRNGDAEWIINSNGCELASEEFLKEMDSIGYNYKHGYGSITDAGELKSRGVDVVCANCSSGYFNAHSDEEIIHLVSLENTLNLFWHICDTMGHRQWKHTYDEYSKYTFKSKRTTPKVYPDHTLTEDKVESYVVNNTCECPGCEEPTLVIENEWGGFCTNCFESYTNTELRDLDLIK